MGESETRRIFPTTTDILGELRKFAADYARRSGLPDSCVEEITLAIDEAATNIIMHAAAKAPCEIDCTCCVEDDTLVYEMSWKSPESFIPDAPTKEEILNRIRKRLPGGLGIYLMHSLVDDIRYSYQNGVASIRFQKHIQH